MFAPLVKESPGFKELKKQVIDSGLCSLCGSCGLLCEKIDFADTPFLQEGQSCVTAIGAKNCGTLGCCYDNCPMTSYPKKELEKVFFVNTHSDPDFGSYREILSARSTNEEILSRAQNGGTVTSLLAYALSNDSQLSQKYKGAVITKRGKDWKPIPLFASKYEELLESCGSIYSRLPLSSQIRKILREIHPLIFVGSGCQTTGVRKYQSNFLNKVLTENTRIFTIGLFCYENFPYSQLKVAIEKKYRIPVGEINKMDIEHGNLYIHTEEGRILENPIGDFNSIVPEACKFCTNFTAELANISIGSIGSKPKWNTVIIRDEEGLEFIEKAVDDGIIETTTNVSLDSIRKVIARKRKGSEKIAKNRRSRGHFVPDFTLSS
ncbi:MAG: Coenzyme F420 hydrogenase/dehydrogenase, beta subunit C-terminal domain [Candidatus Hodarchaeales archaeon]|jgi:coenzyme F420 hydrogenase subunit beta